MAKAKPKKDPYAGPAQAASLLRYGPELSTLTALLKAAEQTHAERVQAAGATRQQIQGSIMEARPQVKAATVAAQSQANASFAAAGRPAGIEGGALAARLAESDALSTRQLAQRDVSAVEGAGAARDQALRDFRSDRGKIGDRASALSQEMGAFASSTASELRGADASAAQRAAELAARLGQSDRNSRRSANTARANSQRSADTAAANRAARDTAKDAAANAKKWRTPEQHAAFASQVSDIAAWAKRYPDLSRSELVDQFQAGRAERYVDGKGATVPKGTPGAHLLPAIPKFKADLAMSAALDIARDERLGRTTQDRIRTSRLKVGDLGLPTYGEWLRRQRSRPVAPVVNAPGANGQLRPT